MSQDAIALSSASSVDDLLEQYLDVLDKYTSCREHLSREFSSGFFDLAHANFVAPNRKRFGQDYYDDRMQAILRVNIKRNTVKLSESSGNVDQARADGLKPENEESSTNPSGSTLSNQSLMFHLLESLHDDESSADLRPRFKLAAEEHGAPGVERDAKLQVLDPVRQFGILVPPQLRAAQASFSRGVQEQVLHLADVSLEMKILETKIVMARKASGHL